MGSILLMGAGLQTTVTGPTYDPDAQLFFNAESAAGVTLTTTQKDAVNQWVVDSKAANIWTKFKAIYPMVGGTATSHKFNLKNPLDTNAAFRLAFNGGWTHSSNGALPNGTNAYASTFLIPNTVFGSGYAAIGIYINQALTVGGARPMGSTNMDILVNTTFVRGANKASTNTTVTATLSMDGFIVNSRVGAADTYIMNRNRTFVSSATTAVATYATTDIVLGATNSNGTIGSYSTGNIAFAFCSDFLTQNESLLLYQITEKYQVALSRSIYPAQSFYYNPAYNNETNAFLFSTQITDTTIQTATNTLVSDLKTANIFTKMKAIYPMVGGTATTCKFNLVNAQDTNEAFRLVFSGGGTFSANGYQPNGTNAYADTFLIPSAAYSVATSGHMSYYSRTDSNGANEVEMGALTSFVYTDLAVRRSNLISMRWGETSVPTYAASANSLGFYVGSKTTATTQKIFKNGVQVLLSGNLGNQLPSLKFFIGAFNLNGTPSGYYSAKQCAFASIGDGLTDAEALAFYNAVNAFQVSLARNV